MEPFNDTDLRGLRVLVVEDPFPGAPPIDTTLKSLGCSVIGPAPRLDKALALIEDRPDCAILDLNLDGENAYPLADALRQRAIPFLLTTGYDAGAIHPELQDVLRLEKPFGMETLIAAMRDAFLPKRV